MPREASGTGRYKNVITTLSDDEYAALLAWIEKQPDPKPTRSVAVRAFVLAALRSAANA